jgi:hypothetical protein
MQDRFDDLRNWSIDFEAKRAAEEAVLEGKRDPE